MPSLSGRAGPDTKTVNGSQYGVVTPRQTRLIRTPSLPAFQHAVSQAVRNVGQVEATSRAVLVPTCAAAVHLRRTLTDTGISRSMIPVLLTRAAWYDWLRERLKPVPRALTAIEREVISGIAARDAVAAGVPPPFELRPGLVSALLAFYDELRRHCRSIDAFEHFVGNDLEPTIEVDSGAQRLLLQTHFLVAAFRAYELRRDNLDGVDEHQLRALLLVSDRLTPMSEVIVTIPDQVAHPFGLYAADFDLLARLPHLEQITLIATDALLDCGYRERLDDMFPGLDEERVKNTERAPVVVVPNMSDDRRYFVWRDREEELRGIACELQRRVVDEVLSPGTVAVVVQRPLPYLYLAPSAFDELVDQPQFGDELPLATEPYAAAVDLVFDCVHTDFQRRALVALLCSPHFALESDGHVIGLRDVWVLDRALRESGFFAGRNQLAERLDHWDGTSRMKHNALPALRCALALADELDCLRKLQSTPDHLKVLRLFLVQHASSLDGSVVADRTRLVRDVVWNGLQALEKANLSVPDTPEIVDFTQVISAVRRWIEGKTFPSVDPHDVAHGGFHLLDPYAAIYGRFDDLFLAGLVESDWPVRRSRNIFYPTGILAGLGWPNERDRFRNARAAFNDLLGLASARVWLSTFTVESDARTTASTVLDELDKAQLECVAASQSVHSCVGLRADRPQSGGSLVQVKPELWQRWRDLRLLRVGWRSDHRFKGTVGPRPARTYAVGSLERYLECPFKYFAHDELHLEEDEGWEEERTLTARQRGRLLHEVFEVFFRAWQVRGQTAITLANLEEALDQFTVAAERILDQLEPSNRAVMRTWLLGSAAAAGLAERVFVAEISDPMEVVERLLEHQIEGQFEVGDETKSRIVNLRGVIDRVDLCADQTFRVIDYRANQVPPASRALQLPIYAQCVETELSATRGSSWRAAGALYIAFGDPRTTVSLPGRDLSAAIRTAETRVRGISAAVESGNYPPRPADLSRCVYCPYPTVCRKDYVEEI